MVVNDVESTPLLPATKGYSNLFFYAVAISLLLVNLNNQLSRWMLANIQPQLSSDLHITKEQFGFAAGYGFSLVFVISGIPAGMLADKFRPKFILIGSLVTWSVLTCVTALCKNYWQFLIVRIGIGIAESACVPSSMAILTRSNFNARDSTTANSIFNAAIYIGVGLATGLGRGLTDLIGWEITVLIFGAVGVGFGVICFFTLPNVGINTVTIPENLKMENDIATKPSVLQTFLSMFGFIPRWVLPLAGGFRQIGGFTYGFYIFNFLDYEYNLTNSRPYLPWIYGLITSVSGLLSVTIGVYATNNLKQYFGNRSALLVSTAGAVIAIPFVAGILFMKNISGLSEDLAFTFAMVCVSISYLAAEVWGGPCTALYATIIDKRSGGVSFAIYFFVMVLMGASGPELVAMLPASTIIDGANRTRIIYSRIGIFCIIASSYILSSTLWCISSVWISNEKENLEENIVTDNTRTKLSDNSSTESSEGVCEVDKNEEYPTYSVSKTKPDKSNNEDENITLLKEKNDDIKLSFVQKLICALFSLFIFGYWLGITLHTALNISAK